MAMETLPTGTQLRGRYRVERVLGNGGFGHVYLAVDLQTRQQYALKEYLVTGESGRAQLEHEARVLGHLHHPSLPAFQDAFNERGRHYVVLGYIEGRDLTDCIRAARQRNEIVPLERILNWLISICEAVTFLHNQQPPIIHRDIKPDNIRITPSGTAILVDLGNAKAAADGARTLLFIRHQGTPGYAPLEQYPGGSGTDTRSDVYALGGTLFFALTAHEPPSVSTRKQSSDQGQRDLPSLQELLKQNPPEASQDPNIAKQFRLGINKPVKPTPRHSRHLAQLGALTPDLLNRLNLIIMRAMAMDPWDRYQSVADLSTDLQRVRAALTSSTQPAQAKVERPVDPHSTQPDLPFLFEALQNTQRDTTQPSPDSSSRPGSPISRPVAPESSRRCPRCQAEVKQTAAFCPRCGTPVSAFQSNDPDNDSTVLITPPSAQSQSASPPMLKNAPGNGGKERSTGQHGTPGLRPQQSSSVNAPAPPVVRSSTPPLQQAQSRPFLEAIAQPPLVIPGTNTVRASPTGLSVPSQSSNPPASQKGRVGIPKFFLFFVIAIVVVVVVVIIFLLAAHHGVGAGKTDAAPLQYVRSYATSVQGYNYERNFSLFPAAAAAHPGTGLR